MLTPRLKSKLFATFLITPALFFLLGAISNNLVKYVNQGFMPVEVPAEVLPPGTLLDETHYTESDDTRLKYLDDRFAVGHYLLSIGDFGIEIGESIAMPALLLGAAFELRRKPTP